LECVFSVPKVSVALTEDNVEQRDLVKVAVLGLGFHLTRRTFDLSVFVCLQRFVIEDCQQHWGPDFQYIATSDVNSKAEVVNTGFISSPVFRTPSDYMIQGLFQMFQTDSPEYSNVDQSLNIYFNTLHVMFNRETLVKVLDIAKSISTVLAEIFSSPNPPIIGEVPNNTKTFLKVTANMQTLDLTLNREGVKLSKLSLSNFSGLLEIAPPPDPRDPAGFLLKTKGTLGKILLEDMLLITEGNKYPHIFVTSGDHMVEFSYETYGQLNSPGYDSLLRIRMNSLKFTYFHKFFSEVEEYFKKFKSLSDAIKTSTASLATKAEDAVTAKPTKKHKFMCEIANPQVVVPQKSTSSDLLLANLGSISVYNRFDKVSGN